MAVDMKTVKRGISRLKEVSASFIWEIQQMSCRLDGSTIQSDIFSCENDETMKWRLELRHHELPYISNLQLCAVSAVKFKIDCDVNCSILNKKLKVIKKMKEKQKLFTNLDHKLLLNSLDPYWSFEPYLQNDRLIVFVDLNAFVAVQPCSETNKCDPKLSPVCLSSDLRRLLDDSLGDLTLSVKGKKLKVFKAIVMARSPVLAALVAEKTKLHIPDVDFDVMQQVVHYMYTDQVVEIEKMADRLYLAACRFGLLGLKTLCEDAVVKCLTVDNVAQTLVDADGKPEDFKTRIINFAKSHVAEVMATAGFKSMAAKHPHLFLEVFCAINDVTWDPHAQSST